MKKSYTHFLTRTALATVFALSAHNALASQLQLIKPGSGTNAVEVLVLGNDRTISGYTDNTFTYLLTDGTNGATAYNDLAPLSITGSIESNSNGTARVLTLNGVHLTLANLATGDNDVTLQFYPQQKTGGDALFPATAIGEGYATAYFANNTALQNFLGKYLTSSTDSKNFKNIQVWNGASYASIQSMIPDSLSITNISLSTPGSAAAFDMLTNSTNTLLKAETSIGSDKTLSGDVTIALAGFNLAHSSDTITGNTTNSLTVSSSTGTPVYTVAADGWDGEFSAINVSGSAIVKSSIANFTSGTIAPVTVTGTAKFQCASSTGTTFGTLTLG